MTLRARFTLLLLMVILVTACGGGSESGGGSDAPSAQINPNNVNSCIEQRFEVKHVKTTGSDFVLTLHVTVMTNTCNFTVHVGYVEYVYGFRGATIPAAKSFRIERLWTTNGEIFIACRAPAIPERDWDDGLFCRD